MINKKIGIIGCGNMGEALLAHLSKVTEKSTSLMVSEMDAARRDYIQTKYRIIVEIDNNAVIKFADVIILAVKPQDLDSVLKNEICCGASKDKLLISIAAGVTTRRIEKAVGKDIPVIRAMPNMAARIGEAITSLSAGSSAAREHIAAASEIFSAIGEVVEVPEPMVDAVTAVSGSGPAYFFYMVEALIAAAKAAGIEGRAAKKLVLKTALGVWDHIKNQDDHGAENYELDWLGFLPGKRESRRYLGDHVITQNDVRSEGKFDDLVAYGGWSMDDHHPEGFHYKGAPTIFHKAPSPFGIPYRSLYSRNVENLFCAGRNISATHMAMSATRVMATCSMMGQAVGTAAGIATREGCAPRTVHDKHLRELQQTLMSDDCYLPWQVREISELSRSATLTSEQGDVEALRNGVDRPVGDDDNAWDGACGTAIDYDLGHTVELESARIVFDSNLNRSWQNMPHGVPLGGNDRPTPETLVKAFRLDARQSDGSWETVYQDDANHQRLVRVPLKLATSAVRFVPLETHGAEHARLFALEYDNSTQK